MPRYIKITPVGVQRERIYIMKKVVVAVLCVAMLALTACGMFGCKVSGCDLEAYKSGYCEVHYAAKALETMFG